MEQQMIKQAAAQAGDAITQKATYLSAGVATVFGFNADVFIALTGAVLGLLTFLLNLWYKYQVLQLEKQKCMRLTDENQRLGTKIQEKEDADKTD